MFYEDSFPYSHQLKRASIVKLRHFFHGFGGSRGPFHPNHERGGKRFFKRGQLKFALLELLSEEAMHGYQMIKALEEKTNGFYTPSPGSIYPTLQMLEDQDYVVSKKVDGKNQYQITVSGRDYLQKNRTNESFIQAEDGCNLHQAVRNEANELHQQVGYIFRQAMHDPKQLESMLDYLKKVNRGLRDLIDPDQNQ